ncbi:MAG: HPP family protein [Mariprofundus sp.]
MLAAKVMVTDIVTARADETVEVVLDRMRSSKLRMIPVLDADQVVIGVISTFSIMEKVVPSYIVTGDLNQISYAPDIGILRRHYKVIAELHVADVMDVSPLLVNQDESLLSVAAAMISFTKHEYAMVVDEKKHLLGIVSVGDILDRLKQAAQGGDDA